MEFPVRKLRVFMYAMSAVDEQNGALFIIVLYTFIIVSYLRITLCIVLTEYR